MIDRDKRDRACGELAASQWGALSRAQALELGHTSRTIRGCEKRGAWIETLPGVYVVNGAPAVAERTLSEACLWAGPGAMVAARAAAAVYGLRSFRLDKIEIASPRRRNPPPGIVFHRISPSLSPVASTVRDLPVSSVEKTVFDLGAVTSPRQTAIALDDALRKKLTSLDRMWEYLDSIARRGRTGVTLMRTLLSERDVRYERVRAQSETDVLQYFDDVRLPRCVVDHEIRRHGHLVAIADFSYPEYKIDIEIDGAGVHLTPADISRDKRRDRELVTLGWRVIRFPWDEVLAAPHVFIAEVGNALRACGHPFFS